ncbi:GGDEF domain-containing protein [Hydrogenobacter sp. T-2]|uniref:GGDEF domain-containing protein n=1 Tax=Pampinifervens diazotrophicum TaxID=1632018 RepID=UPI002B257D5D|nr:GGDEF domain-containing protein [Hydrogenobacter sp. T-2]WPM31393.1 GGDEF domain-containing protein [Hydrogenobacter sp. T-2]
MGIKKRVSLSLAFSLAFTLAVSFLTLYLISSQILERRIKETYRLVYDNYRELLKREEKNLSILVSYVPPYSTYYYREILSETKCEEVAYYRITSTGPYYGISRQYPEGCFFMGVNLEEILRFMESLMGIDWVIYYDREFVPEISGGNLDAFMKDKVVISNMVIDRFSKQYVLTLTLNVRGYMLYGSFLEKILLMEVPLTNIKGVPIGRVILIKDVSALYREAYMVFLVLALYSVFVLSFLAVVLFRIVSTVVNRIVFLKDITARIEKKDFTVAHLLENSKERWKDEVYELKHSIYNMALSLKSTFEELEKKKSELEQLAYYDPLTGLPNRRFFFDHANLILESSKRYGNPLSLLIIDIDHFKKINDTYGHEAGDLVLKSFADILRKNIRQSDLSARLGGEEFVLLMPNTNLQRGKVVAERIRSAFQNSLIVYEGKEVRATLSVGLAGYKAGVESIDDIIRMADEALYKAKELGRNRIEVYDA